MSQGFIDQSSVVVHSIAATTAINQEYKVAVDMRKHRRIGIQNIFTAGGGGGSLVQKVYANCKEYANDAAALADYAASEFIDVTNDALGAATLTASGVKNDKYGVTGCYTWLIVSSTIANKDAATALYTYVNRVA